RQKEAFHVSFVTQKWRLLTLFPVDLCSLWSRNSVFVPLFGHDFAGDKHYPIFNSVYLETN
ncbi:hypothetical protein, partial [Parabacteroides goldsteinii]|uniref:hypothetical protein n=1 Tax=Parabacteroides goldsteinii TaxID=328812 RepID=UPI0025757189